MSDGKLGSNCTLQIKVKDINDNDPVFEPTNYQASVPEVFVVYTMMDFLKSTDTNWNFYMWYKN